jgi:hypothetical protein
MDAIAASEGVDLAKNEKNGVPLPTKNTEAWRKNVDFVDASGTPKPIDEGFRPNTAANAARDAREAEHKAETSARQAEALLATNPAANANGDVTKARQAANDAEAAARAAEVAAKIPDKPAADAQKTIAKAKAQDAKNFAGAAAVQGGAPLPPPAVAPPAPDRFKDDELEPLDGISGTITTVQWNPHMQRVVPAQHIPNGASGWNDTTKSYATPGDVTATI